MTKAAFLILIGTALPVAALAETAGTTEKAATEQSPGVQLMTTKWDLSKTNKKSAQEKKSLAKSQAKLTQNARMPRLGRPPEPSTTKMQGVNAAPMVTNVVRKESRDDRNRH
jgi:hypothetical protein